MRIFAAASTGGASGGLGTHAYDRVLETADYPNVLIAFPYDPDCDYINQRGIKYQPDFVVTDSGAFTVWRSGGQVDLDAYVAYCRRYQARRLAREVPPAVHVSLDVIPGDEGRTPTAKERKDGMARSLENGDAMRAAGLPIMEVYHHYEPAEFLHQLLDRRQPGDLIGLSPRNDAPNVYRRRFLDGVFHQLAQRHGRHEVPPCHGLGVGGRELLARYPWWSCDAISWVAPGTYGRVMSRDGTTRREETTKGNAARMRHCEDFLARWKRTADQLTEMWAQRGVAWQTPPKS